MSRVITKRRSRALIASMAAVTGAALAAAPAALATFPGGDGQIAFVRDGDIWAINPDGSGEHRITAGPHQDSAPDWSPDGRELVFERRSLAPAAPSSHVYRVRADGTGLTWITADAHEPAWFRDGRRIAFNRGPDGDSDVFLMNRDGSGQRTVEEGLPALHDPDPSPVSDFVLVNHIGHNADGHLLATSPGTGDIRWDLPDPDGYDSQQGSWAPDGRRLAFYRGAGPVWAGPSPDPQIGVAVMDVEGTGLRIVAPGGFDPAFSPDGSRIAYVDGTTIHTIRDDGSGRRALTRGHGPDWQAVPAPPPAPPGRPPTRTITVTVPGPPPPPVVITKVVTKTIRGDTTCRVPQGQLAFTVRAARRIGAGAKLRLTVDLRGERPQMRLPRSLRLT